MDQIKETPPMLLQPLLSSVLPRWGICCALVVLIAACNRAPEEPAPPKPVEVVAVTTELATIAADEAPHASAASAAHAASPERKQATYFTVHVNPAGRGAAYVAKVGAKVCVVHNGKRGTLYPDIDPGTLRLSPDGQHVAYGAKGPAGWLLVVDGQESGPFDAIGPPVISPDSSHVACEVQRGEKWHVSVDGQLSAPAVSYYDKPHFSADSSKVLYVENTAEDLKKQMVIADRKLKILATVPCIAKPIAISEDRSRVAAVTSKNGKYEVVDFKFARPKKVRESDLYDEIGNLALSADGRSLAYVAAKGGTSFAVLDGKEEPIPKGDMLPWPTVIRPGNKGVGIQIFDKSKAFLHQAFAKDAPASKLYTEVADLAYSADGNQYAHIAIDRNKFLTVVNGVAGPLFDRVLAPKFSPDGRYVAYRARKDNKRFMVVADSTGKVLRQHPSYEQVFDPAFTADGKSVAYGVLDGKKIIWKVEPL